MRSCHFDQKWMELEEIIWSGNKTNVKRQTPNVPLIYGSQKPDEAKHNAGHRMGREDFR